MLPFLNPAPPTQCWACVMVYYQKLFRRCSQHWTGGEGETKFVLSKFNNFVQLAGMVSRVLSKIVASRTKIHEICSCKKDIERYKKTARILKLILKEFLSKNTNTGLFALDWSHDWDQCRQPIALPYMASQKA
jgi:hypothetical protein